MTNKSDCCKDYLPELEKINNIIVMSILRMGNSNLYKGKPFSYCPWCGGKLITLYNKKVE